MSQVSIDKWGTLACLSTVAVVNQWARNLFVYMSTVPTTNLDATQASFVNLQVDLALDSAQYGLISGESFANIKYANYKL